MSKTIEQVKAQVLNAEINPFEIYNEISNAIQFELRTPKEIADKIITNAVMNYPSDIHLQICEIEYRIEEVIKMRYA